jgi:hypothetical protein
MQKSLDRLQRLTGVFTVVVRLKTDSGPYSGLIFTGDFYEAIRTSPQNLF